MPRESRGARVHLASWPIRCLACERRLSLEPGMVFGRFRRCPECRELLFVLIVPDIRAGFVAIVQASEASALGRRRLTPLQVLRELGLEAA